MKDYKELERAYYDPETGFVGANKLKEKVKGFTLKEIKDFLAEQEVNQIHSDNTKKIRYFPITGPPGTYQADLTFFRKYKRSNGGFEYLLTCINVNTRKAYVKPLKTKTAQEIFENFEKIILECGDMIHITTDKGTDLGTKSFSALMKKHGISHFIADAEDKNKMGKIERFNLTIRQRIELYLTANNTNRWIDALEKLVKNYNNTKHGSTGIAPNKVSEKDENIIRSKDDQRILALMQTQPRLTSDDRVRLRMKRGIFEKKSGAKYEDKIRAVEEVNPFSYRVEGVKRSVKPYEIKKVGKINKAKDKDESFDRKKEVKDLGIERNLKSLGIHPDHILNGKRDRKKIDRFSF